LPLLLFLLYALSLFPLEDPWLKPALRGAALFSLSTSGSESAFSCMPFPFFDFKMDLLDFLPLAWDFSDFLDPDLASPLSFDLPADFTDFALPLPPFFADAALF